VRKLTCQGSLAGGLNGQITIGGAVSGHSVAQAISVHAAVTGTNEARHGIRGVRVPVQVFAVAASGPLPGAGPHSSLTGNTEKFGLIIAGLLLAVGIVLALLARRRPRPVTRTGPTPPYPAARGTHDGGPAAEDPAAEGLAAGDPAAEDPAAHSTRDEDAHIGQD